LLERLEQHIFATFRLKLDAMRLTRIATFAISVGTDGRLKVCLTRPTVVLASRASRNYNLSDIPYTHTHTRISAVSP
jgi:hypothetical protein